ncbi:MAG: leucine-rich repeat domain-containing protein [Bacillus sp. (in: Bacteria)]|nr:leucine-rich repeat domain-containing protein [Bacillus sp. (in: firmicutes)]
MGKVTGKGRKMSIGGWNKILTAIVIAVGIGCTGCGAESAPEAESHVAAEAETETETETVQEADAETAQDAFSIQDINNAPLLTALFSFEKKYEEYQYPYMVITGIADKYRHGRQADFWKYMRKYTSSFGSNILCIPDNIRGLPVRAIGENAFADMTIERVQFPDSIAFIDPGAFKNTGLSEVDLPEGLLAIGNGAFEKCRLEYVAIPESVEFIDERVFAGNPTLWTALIVDNSTVIKEDVFADCADDFLLCYGENGRDQENRVAAYAETNGFASKEIFLSQEPVVNFHEEPLVLQPRVDNFFYGDYGDIFENWDEELWCSWEYDENAPNFGYSDWQWSGCSSWCGVWDFEQEVTASSELASGTGRYSADNVTKQERGTAWAEGVDGNGVGESLLYRQRCVCGTDNEWDALCQWKDVAPRSDGFLRYTEICIVNGYARDESVWEKNGRVKKLMMYVEDKPYACLELEDTIFPQYFTLPEDDIKVLNGGMLEVRYEIMEVYPGSEYEDTCLTGLVMEFSGRYAH